MVFNAMDSLSSAWDAFTKDVGYVVLRTLAYSALVLVLVAVSGGILLGTLLAAGVGIAGLASLATSEASLVAAIGALGVAAFVAIAVLLVTFVLMAMIQLGFIRSLFRYVVSGEKRYDLFAPLGKTLQLVGFYLLMYVAGVVASVLIGMLVAVSPIIGILLVIAFALFVFWFLIQLTFTQYRLVGHDENVFAAASGSYRMLAGSRWAFFFALLLLTIALTAVTFVLNIIPVLGQLLTLVLNFLLAPLVIVWLSVVHQALDPTKSVR